MHFPCFPTPCLAEPRRDAATSGALQPEEIWHIASLVGPAPLTWWQLDALPAHGVGHSFEYTLLTRIVLMRRSCESALDDEVTL